MVYYTKTRRICMNKYRIEEDCLGQVQVEADKYWKSQTQRSIENFKIGYETMPESIIVSFAILKSACAKANLHFNKITQEQCKHIIEVCKEIEEKKHMDQFPLKVWQTGSGTQTNMNVNEVISMMANERAEKNLCHPNDTVNCSQSSNDTFPAALHIMIAKKILEDLIPELDEIIETFKKLEEENKGIIKIGRTHLQDATPLYFSQELSGYRSMIEHSKNQILNSLNYV